MNILITGGAGYIGSHTIVELLKDNHDIVVVDNLSNSSREALRRIKKITNKEVEFYEFDLRNRDMLDSVFSDHHFDAVIHFAGLKSVGESVSQPIGYYDNNIVSTLILLEIMKKHDVKKLVFSSSATVYGDPTELPIKETSQIGIGITNPYGQTKFMIEQILKDLSATGKDWNITSLRYFNPIGAHGSGIIGEDPSGIPNNLLPYVSRVAAGSLDAVNVFGNDYDTPDGTGVRDYIHVVDLAKAHLAALNHLNHSNIYKVYNIGTGKPVSVLEIIDAFKKASGKDIPYKIVARRPGDIAACYADPTLANKELGWKAKLSVQDACDSSWKWQSQNPNGYKS